jgi:hypothetical protein
VLQAVGEVHQRYPGEQVTVADVLREHRTYGWDTVMALIGTKILGDCKLICGKGLEGIVSQNCGNLGRLRGSSKMKAVKFIVITKWSEVVQCRERWLDCYAKSCVSSV